MNRRLYFDIDGTLLIDEKGIPKPHLADGAFEYAVRSAGFEEIVCVGNFVAALHAVNEVEPEHDGIGAIFALCGSTFTDEAWFRSACTLVKNPMDRAREIDLAADWWYVDDLAEYYLWKAGREEVFKNHVHGRIMVPEPAGDGADIMGWLQSLR
jgi:hypothetical protein